MVVYLKEVQMENFKSFGKRLVVPFYPGFTAITGPNGSGKSNIVDAILFVLGPKSSKVMRAGRLTDLIFNGGKLRKTPAKYCKVSLLFDNRQRRMPVDADEVGLTRMIKRAPLKNDPNNYYSYFYINNKAASFSEFETLLTHARISGDGYNIIKQGDVTNFIKMGLVDRRRILDDVAGISTFDQDIKKAEQEQENVETNLDRITIILNEINSQIRQLKHDRDGAYRYKELKDELYETKAKMVRKKQHEVQNQIAEIQTQIQSYEKEQSTLKDQQETLKKQYTTHMQELKEIENKISEVGGEDAEEIREKIDAQRTEEIKIEEKINFSNDEILSLKNEKETLTGSLEQVARDLEELNSQYAVLSDKLPEKEQTLTEKEHHLNALKDDIAKKDDTTMDITRDLVTMREEYTSKQTKLHELTLSQDRLMDKKENMELQIAEIQETKSAYEFELKDIDWQIGEIKKETKKDDTTIKKLEQHLLKKKKEEAAITEELSDLETAIMRLQREHAQLQAELDAAATVHAKYNQAVNAIITARDDGSLTGVHGTIAELAKVDEHYQTALEIAAGYRMQSIVVDDDAAGAAAISFLKKHGYGRATFLPLNKMVVGKPRAKALLAVKDDHAHGFAYDLVKFHDRYNAAFWYVFGDTVIVENLSDARRLMGGVRLVDTKGNLIEASGAMIGGSKPKTTLFFSTTDRSKLDTISEQLHNAIHHQEEFSEKLRTIRQELTDIETELRQHGGNSEQTLQIKDLEVRKKEFKGKLAVVEKDLTAKKQEQHTLDGQYDSLQQDIKTIELRLQELDQLKEEKGKHLLKSTNKEIAQEIRSLESEVSKLQEETLQLRSEQQIIQKKRELIGERNSELIDKIHAIEREITTVKQDINELKKNRSVCQDELKALMNVEQQMSGKIKTFAEKRDELYKKTVAIENDLDKCNTRAESFLDLISRAKYRLPTLEDTMKDLEQEYALYQVEVAEKNLPSLESLKQTVRTIEETMQELEPVNMRALEEYDHQQERKSKFDDDVKHLKEQRKNLVKLVDEVTTKKKDRFLEVFHEVNKNFKEIYGRLSEGGEAELLLEDEDNIFEHGLTIKARPRGKKILRLEALSGGEKSIASLAFIFAIQQYDPSPFYVLDEVDMFLDGVNAETVSRMIKMNAQYSQFINVSLRKIVLKEANHIYGVTMHENGISEMIGEIDAETVGPKGELMPRGGVVS